MCVCLCSVCLGVRIPDDELSAAAVRGTAMMMLQGVWLLLHMEPPTTKMQPVNPLELGTFWLLVKSQIQALVIEYLLCNMYRDSSVSNQTWSLHLGAYLGSKQPRMSQLLLVSVYVNYVPLLCV